MFYVQRGADGKVIGVSVEPQTSGEAPLPASHPDVLDFLLRHGDQAATAAALAATDMNLARVVEDLVSLLADRGVVMFTDLPVDAQQKLLLRGRLRSRLGEVTPLVDDEDAIL